MAALKKEREIGRVSYRVVVKRDTPCSLSLSLSLLN